MERLAFTLPDFTRIAWVSDPARAMWEPRLASVTKAWSEVEWRAVLAGARRCSYTSLTPGQFVERGRIWASAGLNALPVSLVGLTDDSYAATERPYEPGKPSMLRLVVGRPDDTAAFAEAWDVAAQEQIGDLLGYPACCREFFRRTWVDEGLVDTTWPMACANGEQTSDTIVVSGPDRVNILWRWMGVRAVPHLPCSFGCDATRAFADDLVAVGHDLGFHEEMDTLDDVLSWPVEWSALHGIAEIRTPILKVAARTDATARTYTVQRPGIHYPREGAAGVRFPYQQPGRVRLTASRGYRRGLDHAAGSDPLSDRPVWYATDNGFSSVEAMNRSHQPVVSVVLAAAAERAEPSVLDLGCGNGALLAAIVDGHAGATPFGVEVDAARAAHAGEVLGGTPHVVIGDLFAFDESFWSDRHFDVVLLMPGRLTEAGTDNVATLLDVLRARCDVIVAYAYGDWLDRSGGLRELANSVGLSAGPVVGGQGAAAAIVTLSSTRSAGTGLAGHGP